jgi:hypothetical protein
MMPMLGVLSVLQIIKIPPDSENRNESDDMLEHRVSGPSNRVSHCETLAASSVSE